MKKKGGGMLTKERYERVDINQIEGEGRYARRDREEREREINQTRRGKSDASKRNETIEAAEEERTKNETKTE